MPVLPKFSPETNHLISRHKRWSWGDLKEKGDGNKLGVLTVSSLVMCSNFSILESYLLISKGIPPSLQECLDHLLASA